MIDRRRFLTHTTAAVAATSLSVGGSAVAQGSSKNLVPAQRSTAPNYWCTWSVQNYLFGQGAAELDAAVLEGSSGAIHAQQLLNERVFLGWARTFHPAVREELYLMIDDGWAEGGTATFRLDPAKFPSFTGLPPERLRALNDVVRAQRWRSLALWCRDTPGGAADDELVGWSKAAGIEYWKVDGGDKSGHLLEARARRHAPLTFEHMSSEPPLSGDWRHDGRFGAQDWDSKKMQVVRFTDVYRTYDTTAILAVSTTLDRAAEFLRGASGHSEVHALLNLEDEVYIAAVLGCTLGVMRHPWRGRRPGNDPDVFFPGTRKLKQRMDEVVRAVRWQRIAAPMPVGAGSIAIDSHILTDNWLFRRGDTFDASVVNNLAKQGAPARIARNMDLPDVKCKDDPPFVICSRFPSGAAAIASLERVSAEKGAVAPRADVRWNVGSADGPWGIFGHFGSLTLAFDRAPKPRRILAQDLAADTAIDITAQVRVRGQEITLTGELIDRVGRAGGTPGDLSTPGLVLAL